MQLTNVARNQEEVSHKRQFLRTKYSTDVCFRVFRLSETSFTWTQDYFKIIHKLQTMYLKPGSVFQYIKDERSLCIFIIFIMLTVSHTD